MHLMPPGPTLAMDISGDLGAMLEPVGEEGGVVVPASYVLHLAGPLAGSHGLLAALDVGGGHAAADAESHAAGCGRAATCVVVGGAGAQAEHHYTINDTTGLGLPRPTIHRVEFTSLARLRPILQALRQQHVFNALVQSCQGRAASAHEGASGSTLTQRAFEVTLTPPHRIHVMGRHPTAPALMSFDVSVALGGDVAASLTLPKGNVVCDATADSQEYRNHFITRPHLVRRCRQATGSFRTWYLPRITFRKH
jgi:hypothetical protein